MTTSTPQTDIPQFVDGHIRFSSGLHFVDIFNKTLRRGALTVFHEGTLEPLTPNDAVLVIPGEAREIATQFKVVSARGNVYLIQLVEPFEEVVQALDAIATRFQNDLAQQLVPSKAHSAPKPSALAELIDAIDAIDDVPPVAIGELVSGAEGSQPITLDPSAGAPPPGGAVQQRKGGIAEIVGIDFGQSFTGAAVGIDAAVDMIPDSWGARCFPSLISYPEEGPPVVGSGARERLITHPKETISSVKRLLGRRYSDPKVAGLLGSLPFKSEAGPNDNIVLWVHGEEYTVTQVCADILRHAVEGYSNVLGRPITKAVLSHPVAFSVDQRTALELAAQIAGIEVEGLIEEPIAVALAYGLGQERNEIVAVYDFGGGTFDLSIVDMSFDHQRVLATSGDAWLGGDDFDLAIAQGVANLFWRQTEIELQKRAVEWQRLLQASEQAKRELTEVEATDLVVRGIAATPEPVDLVQHLERSGFEQLAAPFFKQTLTLCGKALDEVFLEPRDVTTIVVSGGSSRIPLVRRGLEWYFGHPVSDLVNPQEAVALGASLDAAMRCGHTAQRVRGR